MRKLYLLVLILFAFSACQKFYSYEGGTVPVISDSAVYTCTGVVVNGNYVAGTALTNADTILQTINVTQLGTYNFKTAIVNGIFFYATGTFTKTGTQTITLVGSGTPVASGNFTYTFSSVASCPFYVSVSPAVVNAVYTLVGAPNSCTGFVVNGIYSTGNALASYDSVSVAVNVTTAGIYSITTDTVNGMVFSRSGIFTKTGIQNISLIGSGTPLVADTSTFTPKVGASKCSFSVVVQPAIFTCKINGVFTTFNYTAGSGESYDVNSNQWAVKFDGANTATLGFPGCALMQLSVETSAKASVGSYINTLAASQSGKYLIISAYFDATGKQFEPLQAVADTINPFTITITKISTNNIQGSFSGQLYPIFSATPVLTITEGYFNLPFYQ